MADLLVASLLSPIALAFALGVVARLVRSEFSLPKDIYIGLSVYLLLALGLKGGVELRQSTVDAIAAPIAVTLLLGCITPLTSYVVLRRLGRFEVADAAGIAAHYGSVSAVTYIAAQTFLRQLGVEAEGFLPTLLTLLESPGIHIALAIGAIKTAEAGRARSSVLPQVLTGRTMVLLVGGLVVGFLIGQSNWKSIEAFYDPKGAIFRGALTLFLLERGTGRGPVRRPQAGGAVPVRLRHRGAGAPRRTRRLAGHHRRAARGRRWSPPSWPSGSWRWWRPSTSLAMR